MFALDLLLLLQIAELRDASAAAELAFGLQLAALAALLALAPIVGADPTACNKMSGAFGSTLCSWPMLTGCQAIQAD